MNRYRIFRDLESQISHVAVAAAGDPKLQSQAHKIVSQAGMLGLTRMSDAREPWRTPAGPELNRQ